MRPLIRVFHLRKRAGRDFYDVQWYLARKIPIKKSYLEEKMKASGELKQELTKAYLIELFQRRVQLVNWDQAKDDVKTFIKDKNQISLWSAEFFKTLIENIGQTKIYVQVR